MATALVAAAFFGRALVVLDPDFGWHVRLGEIISKSGIPRTDPFSYTMPSYPFVDHEWLTNVGMYQLNSLFGYNSLVILFTLLLATCLLVGFRRKIFLNNYHLGLVFLFLATIMPYFGVRPQVQSWLYLAVLLRLIEDKVFKKLFCLIPLLALLWANVHGSFAILIVVLAIDLAVSSYKPRKIHKKKLIILLLSCLATVITPYFYRSWWEVYMQITDSALRWRVQEWQPSFMSFSLPFIFYLAIYLVALKVYWRSLPKSFVFISLFFFVQAISSTRHVPLWAIAATPLILKSFGLLGKQVAKVKLGSQRLKIAGNFFLVATVLVFFVQTCFALIGARSNVEANFYPEGATEYLSDNPQGRIFSLYNWGGYLIWKLPREKVYIDGRMPSWRYDRAPASESNNTMKDYLDILKGDKDFNAEADKYSIDYVLLPQENIIEKLTDLITPKKEDEFSLYEYLPNNGWEEIYSDNISLIYERTRIKRYNMPK